MKNYIVIGSSSGIGKSITDILVKEGHTVFGSYRNNVCQSSQENLHYFPLDVMEQTIDANNFPESIDGFVYCPGSINLKPFKRFKEQDFLEDYRLQVTGAINNLQAILPKLNLSQDASVVFFSSIAVKHGFGFHAQVSASKGAIEGLTKALSAEFAPKIRVNAIAPSLTDTPLAGRMLNTNEKKEAHAKNNPLGRVGEAEDIASLAAFLLSPKSSWMTGQIIHLDGGYSTIK